MNEWQELGLWKRLDALQGKDEKSLKVWLESAMPKIELVLEKAGTGPLDFTLHDADHSLRVAHRMDDLLSPIAREQLNVFELSILILSAYLHDIGMTPERGQVDRHYRFLLTADHLDLTNDEQQRFQKFLDGREVVPPLVQARALTRSDVDKAAELITYYCRERHNDWSTDWTRKNLTDSGAYPGFVDDVILVCRSHHFGFEELCTSKFDPRYVGTPGKPVNLRFVACILRLADVLEFDPERTPNVVLNHRAIQEKASSIVYWWKDAQMSLSMQEALWTISARPDSARVHKAVEETIDQIDTELATCKQLADEGRFMLGAAKDTGRRYHWALPAKVHRDVKPRNDRYEYIDGAFRPNAYKILTLLSGIELYGNRFAAIRELLQNSFDAVREEIAYKRLNQSGNGGKVLEKTLAGLHYVSLELSVTGNETWLACSDNGIGMSKFIIEKYLLISGSSLRQDLIELERRCSERGFSSERTGRFGIGVLSYFMIADRAEIQTRRNQLGGQSEQNGWFFVTEGVGSFGELRRDTSAKFGTEVRLRLKSELLKGGVGKFYEELTEYLTDTLVRVPCRVELAVSVPGVRNDRIIFEPGWTKSFEKLADEVISNWQYEPAGEDEEIYEDEKLHEYQQIMNDVRSDASAKIRWISDEGFLPDGLGAYRLFIPYFETTDGPLLVYMHQRQSGCQFFRMRSRTRTAWKGMFTTPSRRGHLPASRSLGVERALVDVDITSEKAGNIAVSRNEFSPTQAYKEIRPFLRDRVRMLIANFNRSNANARVWRVNEAIADDEVVYSSSIDVERPIYWPNQAGEFQLVMFPVVSEVLMQGDDDEPLWQNQKIHIIPTLELQDQIGDEAPISLSWATQIAPDRVVNVSPLILKPGCLWGGGAAGAQISRLYGMAVVQFPPEWGGVIRLDFPLGERTRGVAAYLLNKNHPVIRLCSESSCQKIQSLLEHDPNPTKMRDEILSQADLTAAWILLCTNGEHSKLWSWLSRQDPGFMQAVFERIFPGSAGAAASPQIFYWEQDKFSFHIIEKHGWNTIQSYEINAMLKHIKVPSDDEWAIKVSTVKA